MPKAFITGATGFVGSHLADKLLEKGYEVYCLKRSSSSTKWLDGKNINYVNGDLFSNEVLEKTIKEMDYVFHVAGVVKAKSKEGFEKGNNLATKNLIEITYKVNPGIKKFVHISSLAAAGPTPTDKPLTEEDKCEPITTYGVTKRQAELEVLKYADKMNVTIIRPPAVFGPRDTEILVYFKTFQSGLNSVIGFGEKYLSLVYVEELVDGIILAAESENSNGQIYFICMDKAYNWDEIGSLTSKVLNKKAIKLALPHSVVFTVGYIAEFFSKFQKNAATLNVEKCKDITQIRWVCSNGKAKRELGYKQKLTLEEAFIKTIDWYKQAGWLKK
ncbi:MAG: NAD-dependent epimerase/dehydratase family protein [Ignavibacteria bacterium]|nr:NAD-dependent epimerase/dehydratase family protein [Ignavibacteria bacterium]